MSFRGDLWRVALRHTVNLNPLRGRSPSQTLYWLEGMLRGDWIPRGFLRVREHTPHGAVYERLFREGKESDGKFLFYLHGGAYICGLLPWYRLPVYDFYRMSGCEVILPDYRCAPAYPYPCQLEDAWEVWHDLTENRGYRAENGIIGGDSAGANLALALMLRLRDSGKALPRGGFCLSVWGDMTGGGSSYRENYPHDVLFGERGKYPSAEERRQLLESELFCFVGNADRTDPYVSPVFGDFAAFPPMFLTAGGHEMLLSDTLTIAENLRQNGVPVFCEIQPKMFHIYPLCGRRIPESAISYQKWMAFLRERFAGL